MWDRLTTPTPTVTPESTFRQPIRRFTVSRPPRSACRFTCVSALYWLCVSSFPVGFSEDRVLRSGLASEALRVVLRGFVVLPLLTQGQLYAVYLFFTTGGGGSVSLCHLSRRSSRRLHHVVITSSRLNTACACTARLVHGGESRNQDWNYSDQQRRRSASKAQPARHTTASSTLKETLMHARVPIAPRRLGQARHPHPHQGILTTPPGDPHNAPSSGESPSHHAPQPCLMFPGPIMRPLLHFS